MDVTYFQGVPQILLFTVEVHFTGLIFITFIFLVYVQIPLSLIRRTSFRTSL